MTRQHEWTDWSCAVVVRAEDPADLEPAVSIVHDVMAAVSRSADRFRPDSDLSRVNASAGRTVPVSPLTVELVLLALDAARTSRGAVDPTVGRALLDAGYDSDIDVVRARDRAPARSSGHPGRWQDVRVDEQLGLVGVPHSVALDLGSVAKAWTVDEALALIAAVAEAPVLVSIGGDLGVLGAPPGGWEVGVAETRGAEHESVQLESGALATSSTLARRWAGGHHIIDPRSGQCAQGPIRTATVWAPTLVAANVLSTWALVDAAAAVEAVEEGGHLARLVGVDGDVRRLGGWPCPAVDGLAS